MTKGQLMASNDAPASVHDDNPEWTDADFGQARPITDFPALAAVFPNGSKQDREAAD